MDTLASAGWLDLMQIGGFVAAGWYVGNEALRIIWKVAYDIGMQAWEKAKPSS